MGNNLSITSGVFRMTGGRSAPNISNAESDDGLKKIQEDFADEFAHDDPAHLGERAKTDIVIKKDGELAKSNGTICGVVDDIRRAK